MKDAIALALIQRLVSIGALDADDVWAIADELPERESDAVKAAWVYGLCPDGNVASGPTLRIVD